MGVKVQEDGDLPIGENTASSGRVICGVLSISGEPKVLGSWVMCGPCRPGLVFLALPEGVGGSITPPTTIIIIDGGVMMGSPV
jgi:hypothetical protein